MKFRDLIVCTILGTQCFAIAGESDKQSESIIPKITTLAIPEQDTARSLTVPNDREKIFPVTPIVFKQELETSLEVPGRPSLYFITTTRSDNAGKLAGTTRGVGFAYERDGSECILLTAAHVIHDAKEINVHTLELDLSAGSGYEVRLKWIDEEKDLAALAVKGTSACKPILRSNEKVPIGRRVYAFLNTSAFNGLVRNGIVSGLWNAKAGPVIVCDMVVNPGQSGSPLLDAHGELIGMVVSRVQSGEMLDGFAFALPAKSITAAFLMWNNSLREKNAIR